MESSNCAASTDGNTSIGRLADEKYCVILFVLQEAAPNVCLEVVSRQLLQDAYGGVKNVSVLE